MDYKRVLTIAGSDPSGGAGIQADLKTMSACGCFGMSAITAVVDENTVGVYGVHPIPLSFVIGQISSVLDDIGTDAIKIGMLHSSELILGIKNILTLHKVRNIVLDPVMFATSGDSLLMDEAVLTLQRELMPIARVITPNIPEAEILSGQEIKCQADLIEAVRAMTRDIRASILLKAGHLTGDELIDVFYNAETDEIIELKSRRIATQNTHGTGCTLSSAIASFLAKDLDLNNAVRSAKEYINEAIAKGAKYQIGRGHGPVHHFHAFWK
ncbi:MAG: bifunctional hydroxymethylpyrimidine kinase/phosphomethylpyrimidine kinase [Bacteroidales bacterium]